MKPTLNYTPAQSRTCARCGVEGQTPTITDPKAKRALVLRPAFVDGHCVLLCPVCLEHAREGSRP
jgi:hypothetical protein